MNKKKILLVGHMSFDPLGRHIISFLGTLLNDVQNEIYIDKKYSTASQYPKDKDIILNKFFKKELNQGRIHYDTELPYDFNYDFLIFTDSLSLEIGQNWEWSYINRNAKIKICYPVYDGSMPPLHWVKIINDYFDICITPSKYCAHNFRRYGVKIDCFGLDCAILLEDFLKIQPVKNRKIYRFGSIGASDFRKNIPLLIKSFAKTFTKNDDVELFIHSSYGKDITCENEILETYEEYKDKANIILQTNKISHEAMIELWKSFDAYISPQTTTGYFTTPAEACAVGIPVILSDIAAHKELVNYVKKENNLFFVKHVNISSAFHWVFNYRTLGCKFDANEDSYCEALKYVYDNRKELISDNLIKERKEGALRLTSEGLSSRYNLLVGNGNISISNKSYIGDNTFFMSEKLAKCYEKNRYGTLKNITDDVKEEVHEEENNPVFKALEKNSESAYKIYIKQANSRKSDSSLEKKDKQTIFYLFNFIPILKVKCTNNKVFYRLFSFIPLLKIKEK